MSVVQLLSTKSLAKSVKAILSDAYNGRKTSFLKLGFGLATKPRAECPTTKYVKEAAAC